ncbi:heparinase II/III family protein [Paenibacillus sp. GCM10027626]|uniref:heparinase II/III domain-containing protein n=1 Tax=Paenibacillus sp. GCM10027626 TaxID=3273411 RepID=UPI0036347BD5
MNKTMQLVSDWQAIHEKIKAHTWAQASMSRLKQETDAWIAIYEDDAERVAGWGHHYFCDECFAALIFDPEKRTEHRCSGCGKLRDAQEANDAWCYIHRSTASSMLFHAAILHQLDGNPSYMAYIRKVLRFYSDHYGTFGARTPPGQEGMFCGTDLCDAVAVIWMLHGMELVKEQFTAEELRYYKEKFFIPEADFLIRKVGCTPNIICWMKAAAGMIGLFFNERIWCERAGDGEYGIKRKLEEGLLPEGFWYEASFHYHFYCAEGLTYYYAFCKIYDYAFPELEDAVLRMYRYPVKYAFSNGAFPNPNDGWPLLSFGKYAHQYEWIRNVYDELPFRYALAQCYERSGTGDGEGGANRLLFGQDWSGEQFAFSTAGTAEGVDSGLPDGLSRVDKDICFALLQSGEAAVFLKYGYVLREHSHADMMNFELYLRDETVSRDISNSGYGSELFREWQRKTIAHNSLMVDRQNQPNRPMGRVVKFQPENNLFHGAADEVYPGLGFARKLQLFPDRLLDEFTVQPAGDHQDSHEFDWLFHCSGELQSSLTFVRAEPPGDADGYQLMLETACCRTDEAWELHWILPDKTVTLRMEGAPGTTIYRFKGYEHQLDLVRWGVMVRRQGKSASFKASYHFSL